MVIRLSSPICKKISASPRIQIKSIARAGATRLEKWNAIAGPHTVAYHPNLGFEQKVGDNFTLRLGLDETSPAAGITYRFSLFKPDIAYIHDMAKARVDDLFGTTSDSILTTLTFDIAKETASPKTVAAGSGESPWLRCSADVEFALHLIRQTGASNGDPHEFVNTGHGSF